MSQIDPNIENPQEHNEIPTFETFMKEQGGFGRFQLFALIMTVLGIDAYDYLILG